MSNLNVTLNVPKRELRVRVNGADINRRYALNVHRDGEVLTATVSSQETVATGRPVPAWRQHLVAEVKYVVVNEDGSTFFESKID